MMERQDIFLHVLMICRSKCKAQFLLHPNEQAETLHGHACSPAMEDLKRDLTLSGLVMNLIVKLSETRKWPFKLMRTCLYNHSAHCSVSGYPKIHN